MSLLTIGAAIAAFVAGCSALTPGLGIESDSEDVSGPRTVLRPLSELAGDLVRVEVIYLERPADDPLLGPALWDEIDQIGALEPGKREQLTQDGFRIGISSSRPPVALQKLLGELDEIGLDPAQRRFTGRKLVLRSGGTTEVETAPLGRPITVPATDQTPEKELVGATPVLQVTCRSLQEGWAELDFLPEIHFGGDKLRPVATEEGWRMGNGRKAHRFFEDRFTLTLNAGEMAIVTATNDPEQTAGGQFFLDETDNGPVRRLAVIRLVGVDAGETP
ncbi:hypothetical protein [Stratiformator vulcanicus]|uniref:hypothetical protein n=1 Tax=Stratiformator vulcanicus TaxID=2527980 RepID=UPI00287782A7|nr:hypothetical protein [Stratiformator vulcanicus]